MSKYDYEVANYCVEWDRVGAFWQDKKFDTEEEAVEFPKEKRDAILGVLSQDPRPAYDTDETRLYGVEFAGFDVRFTVTGELLQVKELIKLN